MKTSGFLVLRLKALKEAQGVKRNQSLETAIIVNNATGKLLNLYC